MLASASRAAVADALHRQPVPEQQVVRRGVAEGGRRPPRRHRAGDVPEAGRAERLVQRRPPPDTVAEVAHHHVDVVGERLGGGALGPAALVLEHLRQVPVVQRDVRLDAGVEQVVDELRVEVEPGLGRLAAAVGQHPGPRHREAVGGHTEVTQQPDVAAAVLVVAARHVAVAAVDDRPG